MWFLIKVRVRHGVGPVVVMFYWGKSPGKEANDVLLNE